MGFLKKLFGKKSDAKNAYNEAIQNLKQSGVYDEISSISESAELHRKTKQEKSFPIYDHKPKDYSNKIKKCINCNTEIPGGALQCPDCGSGRFVWEARSQTEEHEGSNFSSFVDDLITTGKELQDARINEIQERHDTAATQGKLPAPEIAAKYDCECGSNNTFHIENMNLEGGLDVQCAHCGAVLHVPPTILDHSEYWSAGSGASLVPNWRDQLKFVKHGKQKK